MALSFTSTDKAAQDTGLKILVHGPAGAGKTRLCATTDEPTVIISAEAGLLSLRQQSIPVINVTTIQDVRDAYHFILSDPAAAHFRWVCLDSISEIAEKVLEHEKGTNKDKRAAYGELADVMMHLLRSFRDLPGRNVYMSAKQARTQEDGTGLNLYSPLMPGTKLGQQIAYLFDEVFSLRTERAADGAISSFLQTQRDLQYDAKDRSGALEIYEPAHLGHIAAKIRGSIAA